MWAVGGRLSVRSARGGRYRQPAMPDPTDDAPEPVDPTDLVEPADLVDPVATEPAVPGDPSSEAYAGASDELAATVPLSDAEIRDALPDDLDAAGYVGPYLFPNNNRRRIPAYLYWGIATICIVVWALRRGNDPVLVDNGVLVAAIALILIGAYSFISAWDLDVDERDALVAATRQVGFPVGHASAQMGWRGLLSRPTWRIPALLGRRPAREARPRAGGRRRRFHRRVVRRGQPRRLVGPQGLTGRGTTNAEATKAAGASFRGAGRPGCARWRPDRRARP